MPNRQSLDKKLTSLAKANARKWRGLEDDVLTALRSAAAAALNEAAYRCRLVGYEYVDLSNGIRSAFANEVVAECAESIKQALEKPVVKKNAKAKPKKGRK